MVMNCSGLQVFTCCKRSISFCACSLVFKVTGDADFVQPGLLSAAEQQRLKRMELGPVIAEVAATSCRHRNFASERLKRDEDIPPGKSRYLGVYKHTGNGRWNMKIVRTGDSGKPFQFKKTYDSEEEAASAYDELAWGWDGWCGSSVAPQPLGSALLTAIYLMAKRSHATC